MLTMEPAYLLYGGVLLTKYITRLARSCAIGDLRVFRMFSLSVIMTGVCSHIIIILVYLKRFERAPWVSLFSKTMRHMVQHIAIKRRFCETLIHFINKALSSFWHVNIENMAIKTG